CTLNLAANLARLAPALDVHVISAVGEDAGGELVMNAIRQLPFTAHVSRRKGTTPVQQLRIDEHGERHFQGYDAGVLTDLKLTPTQKAVIGASDWIVTVVYNQVEPFFRNLLKEPRRGRLAVDFMDMKDFGGTLAAIDE